MSSPRLRTFLVYYLVALVTYYVLWWAIFFR